MKEFDCSRFRMSISDELIKEIVVKKGQIFTEADVMESKRLSCEYRPNSKFYVLMEEKKMLP